MHLATKIPMTGMPGKRCDSSSWATLKCLPQHVVDYRDVWPRRSYGVGLVYTCQTLKRSVRETIVTFVVRGGACGLLEHRPNVRVESCESRLQEPVDTVVIILMPRNL